MSLFITYPIEKKHTKNRIIQLYSLFITILLLSHTSYSQSEEIVWTKRTLNDLGIKGDDMIK